MKILFLSFYYPPDLCAGSFRAGAIVKALKEVSPNCQISVVTTLPNRYSSFSTEAPSSESSEGVTIDRIQLPEHRSGMKDQSLAFIHYARAAQKLVANKEFDIVLATSSRLMTAALGAQISRKKKIPLYLDIRDLFVDTLMDVLPKIAAFALKPLLTLIEQRAMSRASKVNLVSRGFQAYFNKRYPNKALTFFTNGIDDEFLDKKFHNPNPAEPNKTITVLYAGNIGEGQGLHRILPELACRTEGKIDFKIFGDGGRKKILTTSLSSENVRNVVIHGPISRTRLIEEYQKADILFLHLNDYQAFKKVLPSKVFEYAATGKPIWAGVPGFSAEFLKNEVENVAVFKPCDAVDAEKSLKSLDIKTAHRSDFIKKYRRSSICKEMAKDILSTITP